MVPGQAQAEVVVALPVAPSVQTLVARPSGAAKSPPTGSTTTLVSTSSLPLTTTSGTPAAPGMYKYEYTVYSYPFGAMLIPRTLRLECNVPHVDRRRILQRRVALEDKTTDQRHDR